MLDSFETPRDIRPKCLKCLQAMPKHSVGLEHQTSYQDNWRATREIVEQSLADSYPKEWWDEDQSELVLSGDQLPYAADVLLEVSIMLSVIHLPDAWHTRN